MKTADTDLLESVTLTILLKPNVKSYYTIMVLIIVKGLENARVVVVAGEEYKFLGIINLSSERRWNQLKREENQFTFTMSYDTFVDADSQAVNCSYLRRSS